MKKLISLALAAVLALGILSGCGKKADAAIQIAVPNDTTNEARALLRSGADDAQLLAAIRETIWAKPREHHFNDSSMPATRGMYRIGG